MRGFRWLAIVLLVSAGPIYAAGGVLDATSIAAIDQLANAAIAEGKSAGLAIEISRRGQSVFERGYGKANIRDGADVTPETVFRIGSATKQFTAAAILLLAERRKLSVDDPLSKFIPEFPQGNAVTLRQLLTHTAGIANYTEQPSFQSRKLTRATTKELVELIEQQRPLYRFQPGTQWEYSNSNYVLLGAVIEQIARIPLQEFLRKNIFEKIGLHHTSVDQDDDSVPHRAKGYNFDFSKPGSFNEASPMSISTAGAAGAMRSTAGDLVSWHVALFGNRILKAESLKEMITPARLSNGDIAKAEMGPWTGEYGFGLQIDKRDGYVAIGHGGVISGFNAAIDTYPDHEIAIAVLANTRSDVAVELEPRIANIAIKALSSK